MKKLFSPRLMIILSMTTFGTLGIFVRNISVSSGELALYRAVLAAALIAVYLLISGENFSFLRPPICAVLQECRRFWDWT